MQVKIHAEHSDGIRERILSLIDSEYESDAAFERALGLKDKTVNNWRRGRSASYMRMLPTLSELFGVNVGELLDIPLQKDTSELSEDELELLVAYRRTRNLSVKQRRALTHSLCEIIDLYVLSAEKGEKRERKKKDTPVSQ